MKIVQIQYFLLDTDIFFSTVSKVLRQKEKYLLQQEEGSRSPAKRSKGRSPDIERALANWARNQVCKPYSLREVALTHQ